MVLINCTENCYYQDNGVCTLVNVSTLSNTTNKGCEFYKEKDIKIKGDSDK